MEATIIYNHGLFQEPTTFEFPVGNWRSITNKAEDTMKVEPVLELIFRQCNCVDGTEWISTQKELKLRSMSVGDMVLLKYNGFHSMVTQLWVCCMTGWKNI